MGSLINSCSPWEIHRPSRLLNVRADTAGTSAQESEEFGRLQGELPGQRRESLTDTVFEYHRTERWQPCSTNLAEEMSYRSSWEQSQGCMGRNAEAV